MVEAENFFTDNSTDFASFAVGVFEAFEIKHSKKKAKARYDDPDACFQLLKLFWDQLDVILTTAFTGLNTLSDLAISRAHERAMNNPGAECFTEVHDKTNVSYMTFDGCENLKIDFEMSALSDILPLKQNRPFTFNDDCLRVWDMTFPTAIQRTFPGHLISNYVTHEDKATYYVVQSQGGGKTHAIFDVAQTMFVHYLNCSPKTDPGMPPVMKVWFNLLQEACEMYEAVPGHELSAADSAFRLLVGVHHHLLSVFLRTFPKDKYPSTTLSQAWFNFHTSIFGQCTLVCMLAYAFEGMMDLSKARPNVDTIIALDDAGDFLTRGGVWHKNMAIGKSFYDAPEDAHIDRKRSGPAPNLYTTICKAAREESQYLIVCSSNYNVAQQSWVDPNRPDQKRPTDEFFILSKVELAPDHVKAILTERGKVKNSSVDGIHKIFGDEGFGSLCEFLAGSPLWISMLMALINRNLADSRNSKSGHDNHQNSVKRAIEQSIPTLIDFAAKMVVRPETWSFDKNVDRMTTAAGVDWCYRAALASFFGALTNMTYLIPVSMRQPLAAEHLARIISMDTTGSKVEPKLDPDVLRTFDRLAIRPNSDGPVRLGIMHLMYKETHPKAASAALKSAEAARKATGTKAERKAAGKTAEDLLARQGSAAGRMSGSPSTMLQTLIHQFFVHPMIVSVSARGPTIHDFFCGISILQAMADCIFANRKANDVVFYLPTIKLTELLSRLNITDAASRGQAQLVEVTPITYIARPAACPRQGTLKWLALGRVGYFGCDRATRPALLIPGKLNDETKLIAVDFIGSEVDHALEAATVAQKFTCNVIHIADQYQNKGSKIKIRTLCAGPRFPELKNVSAIARVGQKLYRRRVDNAAHPNIIPIVYNFSAVPVNEASIAKAPLVPEHVFLKPLDTWKFIDYGINSAESLPKCFRLLAIAESSAMSQDANVMAAWEMS